MEAMTSRICRMRDPRTPAPTFMVALWPDLAAVSACSSASIGWISLQRPQRCELNQGLTTRAPNECEGYTPDDRRIPHGSGRHTGRARWSCNHATGAVLLP